MPLHSEFLFQGSHLTGSNAAGVPFFWIRLVKELLGMCFSQKGSSPRGAFVCLEEKKRSYSRPFGEAHSITSTLHYRLWKLESQRRCSVIH